MSAEAIASGGGIAAGGTVATLQSIGAAGLGCAGTLGAMGGGSVIGATAVGITAIVTAQGNCTNEQGGKKRTKLNRPFCNWTSWT